MSYHSETFSTLFGTICKDDEEAKRLRDERYAELKKAKPFTRVSRSILRNQVRKYASYGVPDGRSCTCYIVSWEE